MAMKAEDIESMIKAAFPDAMIEIKDLAGDGDHYAATIVSEAFRGKTRWSMRPSKGIWAACSMHSL